MAPFKILPFLSSLLFLPSTLAATYTFPNVLANGSVAVEFTAKADELDGPKILPQINDTTYEWWYFDTVSLTTNESVVAVFYESTATGFIGGIDGYPLSIAFSGTFANGSAFFVDVPLALDDSAVVTTSGDGARGVWGGSGFTFTGTSDLSEYVVEVDSEAYGIKGSLMLHPIAPAHYPGGLPVAGASEIILPHVGWSNAVPGAIATASFTIGDTEVAFTGVGYHDKNWGDVPFVSVVSSWYWGHASFGPYTLVWFDALAWSGDESVSLYLVSDGEVAAATSEEGSLVVRPFGENSEYPPSQSTGTPTGFRITATLGNGSVFEANATTGVATYDSAVYGRYIGDVIGGVDGNVFKGRGQWEQFKFAS